MEGGNPAEPRGYPPHSVETLHMRAETRPPRDGFQLQHYREAPRSLRRTLSAKQLGHASPSMVRHLPLFTSSINVARME